MLINIDVYKNRNADQMAWVIIASDKSKQKLGVG